MQLSTLAEARVRRRVIWLVTALCMLVFAGRHLSLLDIPLETMDEYRIYVQHGGRTFQGLWNMWENNTLNYRRPIHTGFYYYTSYVFGVISMAFQGESLRAFAFGARLNALVQGLLLGGVATWVLGRATRWSWLTALLPVFLLFNARFQEMATTMNPDVGKLLFLMPALWCMARFLREPGKPWYKRSMVWATLSFCAKPEVAPLLAFFVALNYYQVRRDGQPFWPEFKWRLRKGAKYFLVIFAVVSPFNFFSLGLFVTSMHKEFVFTSEKFNFRPWTDWLGILHDPAMLGAAVLWVGLGVALAGLAAPWVARRLGKAVDDTEPLWTFVGVLAVWIAFYWGFVIGVSRSFIDRYLDPGWLPFLVLMLAAGALLWRVHRVAGVTAGVALVGAVAVVLPPGYAAQQAAFVEERALVRELQPVRDFMAEFKDRMPADTPLLVTAGVIYDKEHFPQSERFHQLRRYHFAIEPTYLLASREYMRIYDEFLHQEQPQFWYDAERKATATFFQAIRETALQGELAEVQRWEEPAYTLYRFTQPVDAAYVDALFGRIFARANLTEADAAH